MKCIPLQFFRCYIFCIPTTVPATFLDPDTKAKEIYQTTKHFSLGFKVMGNSSLFSEGKKVPITLHTFKFLLRFEPPGSTRSEGELQE